MRKSAVLLAMCALSLSACGQTRSDRALSGGLIGAGAGAAIGAAVGAPVAGASIGAAAGASVAVLTDQARINLGKPLWK